MFTACSEHIEEEQKRNAAIEEAKSVLRERSAVESVENYEKALEDFNVLEAKFADLSSPEGRAEEGRPCAAFRIHNRIMDVQISLQNLVKNEEEGRIEDNVGRRLAAIKMANLSDYLDECGKSQELEAK